LVDTDEVQVLEDRVASSFKTEEAGVWSVENVGCRRLGTVEGTD